MPASQGCGCNSKVVRINNHVTANTSKLNNDDISDDQLGLVCIFPIRRKSKDKESIYKAGNWG